MQVPAVPLPTSRDPMRRRLALALCAVLSVGLGFGFGQSIAAEKEGSAKARLKELRKQRARQAGRPAATDQRGAYPWSTSEGVDYIDKLLEEEWKALGVSVADECTDGEFLRRASLDIIGRIPTLTETESFLRDKSAGARERLVDRLLASEEHGRHWAGIWTRLMITDGRFDGNNQNVNPAALSAWLEKEFNRNTPWNEIVFELISATGRWDENGAVNFVIANKMGRDSVRLTSYVTKLFLCVQTQCTECHDHPWNEWKQEQFHGLDAFFSGTRERRVTKTLPSGLVATDYYVLEEAPLSELRDVGAYFERRNGLTVFVPPKYIDGREVTALVKGEKPRGPATELAAIDVATRAAAEFRLDDESGASGEPVYLRKLLAKAVTAPDNPYFARAIVNRLWHHYHGHGFTKDVDDFDNGQDEPSMPDLLDRLASDFVGHGFDLKRLHRWLATGKAYSLSSKRRGKDNGDAAAFFVSMPCKPMTPEQLYDSILTLTEYGKTAKTADSSTARRAFLDSFRRTFGDGELQTGLPRYNGTITQALMLMNSPEIATACGCVPGTFLHRLATDPTIPDERKVEALYLAALCRKPTSNESRVIARVFREAGEGGRAEALEDVLWALVNSAEFLLNH